MRRLVVALILLVALASGVVLMAGPGAQASPDATITVNSTADTNARDQQLTLREADAALAAVNYRAFSPSLLAERQTSGWY